MGIPGAGKSSVFRQLAVDRGIASFHEPEEEEWPAAVHRREESGRFTAISWFRSQRVPMLYEAQGVKRAGKPVLVDSYFDKLLGFYLEDPAMAWLIAPDDPYFGITANLADLDRRLLPDADVIACFVVERVLWERNLDRRGRAMDGEDEFRSNCFGAQQPFINACERYCDESGALLVNFRQESEEDLSETAARLGRQLEALGVVEPLGRAT